MTKPKKSLDDTASYKILKKAPYESEKAKAAKARAKVKAKKPSTKGPTHYELRVSDLEGGLKRAEGILDIIVRENQGEPDEDLAIEYGGTAYEKHPAVQTTRVIRQRCKDLEQKLLAADAASPRVLALEAWIQNAVKTAQLDFSTANELLKKA